MEALKEQQICEFLSTGGDGSGDGSGFGASSGDGSGFGASSGDGSGDGSGFGFGSGSGYGCGYGSGNGSGFGDGDGNGYGNGYGDGYGYGTIYGIAAVNGVTLHLIDGTLSRLDKVKSNIAKGAIFNRDFTFTPCYVVKHHGYFAHGESVRKALQAAIEKYEENVPEEDRINAFVKAHKAEVAYPNQDFFEWHHKLTGSCETGRKQFAKDHGIDMDGNMTVREFIQLTENDYGGEIIKKLKQHYSVEESTCLT